MKRGVWIVERKWGIGEWTPDPTRAPMRRDEARSVVKMWSGREGGWKLRATRYVPAAELTRRELEERLGKAERALAEIRSKIVTWAGEADIGTGLLKEVYDLTERE